MTIGEKGIKIWWRDFSRWSDEHFFRLAGGLPFFPSGENDGERLTVTDLRCKYGGIPFDNWRHANTVSRLTVVAKGATKLYFMYYLRVVIILFSTGLYKLAFPTCSFGKTRFSSLCVLVFRISVSLPFNFQFWSMFCNYCLLKRHCIIKEYDNQLCAF